MSTFGSEFRFWRWSVVDLRAHVRACVISDYRVRAPRPRVSLSPSRGRHARARLLLGASAGARFMPLRFDSPMHVRLNAWCWRFRQELVPTA